MYAKPWDCIEFPPSILAEAESRDDLGDYPLRRKAWILLDRMAYLAGISGRPHKWGWAIGLVAKAREYRQLTEGADHGGQ